MNTKLTLTIEKSVIEKAKDYANSSGRSLSNIIENYLKALTDKEQTDIHNFQLPPIVKSLKGAFKAPNNYNYKETLTDILEEKYLAK